MNHSEIRRKERLAEVREFAEENQIPVQNIQLLNTALTHTSYANEHKNEVIHDNERLEFLGDAVLDLVVGEYLFLRFPSWPEGELTRDELAEKDMKLMEWLGETFCGNNSHFEPGPEDWTTEGLAEYIKQALPQIEENPEGEEMSSDEVVVKACAIFVEIGRAHV